MLAPRSRWIKRRYYIEGDYVQPIPGSKVELYDPFAADPLPYRELAALDVEDSRAVEAFTAHWGLLGLFHQKRHAEAASWKSRGQSYSMGWVPFHLLHYLPGL